MGVQYLAAGVGVGVYIKGDSLWEAAFWGGATWTITQAVAHPISTSKLVYSGAHYGFTTSLQTMAADALASSTVTTAATVALGAASGAVVGTAISQAIWGDEGAAQALTFYGFDAGRGDANYWGTTANPGYFNIPGNVRKIWNNTTN